MSFSQLSNKWLNRVYKCAAIFLVAFAILISALRLLLPYAHNYRINFQNYINESYGSNIIIGQLHMDWQSSGPALVAKNVSLLQTDRAEIFIQSLDIDVDFWQTIRTQKLTTNDLLLSGVKVLFDKTIMDHSDGSTDDNELIESVSELFLKQINKFSIKNSQIVYRTVRGERTFLIDQLHWLNIGSGHKATGNVIVDGLTSNNLQLQLELTGQQLDEMDGLLYVQANQLNITPWLDKVLVIADENTHSSINFDAWLTIENGIGRQVQVLLGDNQVAWQHNNKTNTVNFGNGQIVLDGFATDQLLQVYSSPISVQSNQLLWQPVRFEVTKNTNETVSYISGLDVAGTMDLLPLFVLDPKIYQFIDDLNPQGEISNIQLKLDGDGVEALASKL